MRQSIKVLRTKYAALRVAGQAIVDTAEREERTFTAVEASRMTELKNQMQTLDVEMTACEAEMDRERTAPTTNERVGEAVSGLMGARGYPSPGTNPAAGKIGARYADLFGPPSRSAFASVDEFFRVIHAGVFDPRLFAITGCASP